MAEHAPSVPMPKSPARSTQDVGEQTDQGAAITFPCESCGGDLTFNPGEQSLKCPFCGTIKEIAPPAESDLAEQDFSATLLRLAELRSEKTPATPRIREVKCDSCGSTVQFEGTLTADECPYCGVSMQFEQASEAPDRIPIDGLLPFLVDRKQAREHLAKWVSSRWFAPNEFKRRGADGKFNGVYLPYWTFDSLTSNSYVGQRGEHYWITVGTGKSRRTVRRTRWYPASGAFQRFFDDVLVVAGKGLPLKRLEALEPWPLSTCVPFTPEVLAGFLARTYDVPLDEGFVTARAMMAKAIDVEVRRRIGGDTQRVGWIKTHHAAITYKHLLLPVWMLTYRFGKKAYQVVVNAQTGEVQGDRPYSWLKIAGAVLAVLAVGAAVAFFMSQK